MKSPIQLTLYDPETSEEVKTLKTAFIPWKLLKKAALFVDSLEGGKLSAADVDNMTLIVCSTFGDKVTPEELEAGADVSEMMTVIQAIIGRVDFQKGGRGVSREDVPLIMQGG